MASKLENYGQRIDTKVREVCDTKEYRDLALWF